MYTAMIAEDSKPILRNIRSLLESSQLPIRVASTAYNGEEALNEIRRQPVDILITDIRMPKLDGLALIEQAKALLPDLKVVLISSYSDFEYTRKALNLQVFDYLLKPVERQALVEVMERIIEQLNAKRTSRLECFRGLIGSAFLSQFRPGVPFFEEETKLPLLLCKQPFTPFSEVWRLESIQSFLSQLYAPHACWVLPLEDSHRFLVLAQASLTEKYGSVDDWMKAVSDQLDKQGIHASMAGIFRPIGLNMLNETCETLKQCIREELCLTTAVRVNGGEQRFHQPSGNNRDLHVFVEMIQQRQKEQFRLKLTEQLRKWPLENILYNKLEELMSLLAKAFSGESQASGMIDSNALTARARGLLELDSYEQFCEALLEWSEQHFERLLSHARKSSEQLFRQIDEYVRLHIYSQLSITDLSKKFHVSPSYISRIMKRHTNDTFVHYYMRLKIDEACKQLKSKPEMKVKELSDALSFSDQHYFSRVFKEYTGFSPTEYRYEITGQEDGPARKSF